MNGLWTEEEGKGRFFLWAPDAVLLWVRKTGLKPPALRMTRAPIPPSPVGMGTAFGDLPYQPFHIVERIGLPGRAIRGTAFQRLRIASGDLRRPPSSESGRLFVRNQPQALATAVETR